MTRFGFVSTYPPTRCGLATFTQALADAVTRGHPDAAVIVRALDAPASPVEAAVGLRAPVTDLIAGDIRSLHASVAALDATDIAIVQHEYGIYGGTDGREVVTLLDGLGVPAIVVLHTVLPTPTDNQRKVLDAVCAAAAAVVVMTDSARRILVDNHHVSPTKIVVIPHGVPSRRAAAAVARRSTKRVLTWGLISEGKGLEWGIRAFDQLRDLDVEYIIAGQTHPKVVALEGERYRDHLSAVIDELGLGDTVTLDGRYLDTGELDRLIGTADVVLLPYESREQATSGVLAEAVAAGIPVVATAFPHSVELLEGGGGLIAGHADPSSLARAVRTIVQTDDVAWGRRPGLRRDAHRSTWPVVAEQYRRLAQSLSAARAA